MQSSSLSFLTCTIFMFLLLKNDLHFFSHRETQTKNFKLKQNRFVFVFLNVNL